jgi:hypothetical protein
MCRSSRDINRVMMIHTYHSRFILKGVAEVSQIFHRNAHVLPKRLNYEKYCVTVGKLIAIWSQHRLSIKRLTKRVKEKSRSDGHSQCEKEIEDHLLACQKLFEIEPLSDTLW